MAFKRIGTHTSDANRASISNEDVFVSELTACFNQNVKRFKEGHRYTEDMKLYAAYTRMLSGKLAYQTFKANAQHAVPSDRAVTGYIGSMATNAIEGVLRSDELLKYLNDLQQLKIVALSEDATRITNRIQYDPQTNQLVGFVLPLGENGMPITGCNQARSASEMEKCFYDVLTRKEKKRATYVNVVMAQPLATGVPAFCLLVFGSDAKYTTKDISKRWHYIKNELEKKGIEVVTFASDSDPKFNSFMKYHINLGQSLENDLHFPEWFNANLCSSTDFMPIQDTVHIGTKLRNRILKRTLKMGKYNVSIEHLSSLLKFTKEKHGLCPSTIRPKDKQNFESVLAICNEKVIDLLASVEGSEATILYLRVLNGVLQSFLDLRLTPIERIRKIWFVLFVLRIWKRFILESGKKYSVEEHFITQNCYTCVEINAHSIVFLMLRLRERKLDSLFRLEMLGSQQCESIFRQIRSLSSTYSTVTNCSILDLVRKMSKIELQNDISHFKLKHWNFPRIGLPSSSYFPTVDRNGVNKYDNFDLLPTKQDIIKEIELAKLEAVEYTATLGMNLKNLKNYACKYPKKVNRPENVVSELTLLSENAEEDNDVLQLFTEANLKQYSVDIDPKKINEKCPYVKIRNKDGEIFCIEKHKLCWFLTQTTSKLSSDRLIRVMAK